MKCIIIYIIRHLHIYSIIESIIKSGKNVNWAVHKGGRNKNEKHMYVGTQSLQF
jgi:hypothetical protein